VSILLGATGRAAMTEPHATPVVGGEITAVTVHDPLAAGPKPGVVAAEDDKHTVIPQPRAVALGVLAIAMALWGRRMVRA
jgi:hypothetical protein